MVQHDGVERSETVEIEAISTDAFGDHEIAFELVTVLGFGNQCATGSIPVN